jgi:hypothetical protein
MTRFILIEAAIWIAVAANAVTTGLWLRYAHDLQVCVLLLHGG